MTDVYIEYIQNDVNLMIDLMIMGLTRLSEDNNHEERTIMRCTLILLEMLNKNISKHMESRLPQ